MSRPIHTQNTCDGIFDQMGLYKLARCTRILLRADADFSLECSIENGGWWSAFIYAVHENSSVSTQIFIQIRQLLRKNREDYGIYLTSGEFLLTLMRCANMVFWKVILPFISLLNKVDTTTSDALMSSIKQFFFSIEMLVFLVATTKATRFFTQSWKPNDFTNGAANHTHAAMGICLPGTPLSKRQKTSSEFFWLQVRIYTQ